MWPYFSGMMASGMSESKEMKLSLPHSSPSIGLLVDYFYGELDFLGYEEAVELLLLANVYSLPNLLERAKYRVLNTPLDVETCLMGWRKGYELDDEEVRMYCAQYYVSNIATFGQSPSFKSMSQDELAQLVQDAAIMSEPKVEEATT